MALPTEWPPAITEQQLEELTQLATAYAWLNGLQLQYLPAPKNVPVTIFPSPFPRSALLAAKQLQSTYNILYARIASDEAFLDRVIGPISDVDSFTGEIWRGWKELRNEGLHEVCRFPWPIGRWLTGILQQYHLAIFRSDYLLHAPRDKEITLKQVEFNTMSVAGAIHSKQMAALHRFGASLTL
jgi:hypothetical protein